MLLFSTLLLLLLFHTQLAIFLHVGATGGTTRSFR
jgi:hypothetical protein